MDGTSSRYKMRWVAKVKVAFTIGGKIRGVETNKDKDKEMDRIGAVSVKTNTSRGT